MNDFKNCFNYIFCSCILVPSHKPKKTPDNYITDSFTDMSIPVYAMVKGVSLICMIYMSNCIIHVV